MREINAEEVYRLEPCLRVLAEYHNEISVNFKGNYPSRPYRKTLELFAAALAAGDSRIAVVENETEIAGFAKVDLDGKKGKLDYLVVLEEYRGRGYGKMLMDWAMAAFRENGVAEIEVKVVDRNPAIHLYEAYGFRMNAHILMKKEEFSNEDKKNTL